MLDGPWPGILKKQLLIGRGKHDDCTNQLPPNLLCFQSEVEIACIERKIVKRLLIGRFEESGARDAWW